MFRPMRVVLASAALSAFSFAAGVAGDLAAPPPVSGARVVVAIPPAARSNARVSLLLTSAAEAHARPSAAASAYDEPAVTIALLVPVRASLAAEFARLTKAQQAAALGTSAPGKPRA